MFRTGVNVGVDVPVDAAPERVRRDRARRRRRRGRAICRSPAASSGIHFAMEYLTLQNRRSEGDDDRRRRSSSPRRTSTSSSSAAATPAPTASARRTARARAASTSSSCCRVRPTSRAPGNPVAAVAEHLPRLVGARGRRRAALLDRHDEVHRRRPRPRHDAARRARSR